MLVPNSRSLAPSHPLRNPPLPIPLSSPCNHQVVFHGSTIAQWRKAGYQDQPEHAAFKQLLQVGCPARIECLVRCTVPPSMGDAHMSAHPAFTDNTVALRLSCRPPRTCALLSPTSPSPQAPQDEAHAIISRRFPTPRFTDCDQNGSQVGPAGTGAGGAGAGCEATVAGRNLHLCSTNF